MKAGGDEVLAELLADPLLSFEDLQSGFDQVDLARSEQVRILTEGGRFGWAVRAAELSADPRLLGRARAAHAEWLASQGLFEIALEPAESARELLGANFEAWPTLARVRLYAGKTAAGLEALGQALDRGLELREAGEILAGAGVGIEIEGVIEFWVERAVTPEGSLEYGRALLLGGRAADALRVLLPLCETENMAAPHALAARACVALSNESMAAAHAERAVELDPKNREYREFAESLREKREKRE
jgi:tetratricopeptide (TPR) repeat protein